MGHGTVACEGLETSCVSNLHRKLWLSSLDASFHCLPFQSALNDANQRPNQVMCRVCRTCFWGKDLERTFSWLNKCLNEVYCVSGHVLDSTESTLFVLTPLNLHNPEAGFTAHHYITHILTLQKGNGGTEGISKWLKTHSW